MTTRKAEHHHTHPDGDVFSHVHFDILHQSVVHQHVTSWRDWPYGYGPSCYKDHDPQQCPNQKLDIGAMSEMALNEL